MESDERIRLLGWAKNEEELIFAVRDKSLISISTPPESIIRAVSVKTGKVRNLTILKDAYFYNIYLSPDKRSIGFTSRLGNRDNVWISSLEGGEPQKLTENNDPRLYFSSLAWSPDGKTIYFGKQIKFTILSMLTNQKDMEEKK